MYYIIRLLVCVCLCVVGILLVNRFSKNNLIAKRVILVVLSVGLFLGACFLPIENVFVSFSSAEQVYEYVNGNADIIAEIEGEESSLVVENENGTYKYLIVRKNQNKWYVDTGINTKMIRNEIRDNALIAIYQYGNTNDYYVDVVSLYGDAIQIVDNKNSTFVEVNKGANNSHRLYYAYVNSLDETYEINVATVDGGAP